MTTQQTDIFGFTGCTHEREKTLVRSLASDGKSQVWERCNNCGKNARGPGIYLSHDDLKVPVESLPIYGNYQTPEIKICDRCGNNEGVQLHHWAPQALFDDADFWPKSWLCGRCHGLWHRHVTPNIVEIGTQNKKFIEKIYKKSDIRKSLGKHESFEVMWLDIPDIETFDCKSVENFLLCCHEDFRQPLFAYRSDGWKVCGYYQAGNVSRMFVLRPVEKKSEPSYDELKM